MKKNSGCSSKQIIIFVEGDTDEVFFKALLDYYKSSSQAPLTPCEVINLKGVTRYTSKLLAKLRNEILPEAKRKNTSIQTICSTYDTDKNGGGCFCGNLFPDVEGDPEVLDFRISDRMQFPERFGQDQRLRCEFCNFQSVKCIDERI